MRKIRNKFYKGYKFVSKWGRLWEIVSSDQGKHTTLADGVYLVRGAKEIVNCQVLHPLDITVKGRGYLGIGKHTLEENLHRASCWRSMFKRCYSGDPHYTSYHTTEVCESWFNFQNFADWYEDNYVVGWDLDKDLKDIKGLKIYSEETCCFLPPSLNKRLSHSYDTVPTKEGKKYRSKVSFAGQTYELGRYHCWVNALYIQIRTRFSILEGEVRNLFGDSFIEHYWNSQRLASFLNRGFTNAESSV